MHTICSSVGSVTYAARLILFADCAGIIRTVVTVQGGPSGSGTLFVDIKFRVPPEYKLLILKHNFYVYVNKTTKGSH